MKRSLAKKDNDGIEYISRVNLVRERDCHNWTLYMGIVAMKSLLEVEI